MIEAFFIYLLACAMSLIFGLYLCGGMSDIEFAQGHKKLGVLWVCVGVVLSLPALPLLAACWVAGYLYYDLENYHKERGIE